ncbi:MAG: DNA polymerase III subunit beta [Scrofimicrobium sp.]
MKLKLARDVFSDAVQWTSRAVQQRPAIPILAAVRLSARDGELELSSFDYEVSARSRVEAQVDDPGEVLVSGRMLSDIAKSLPNSAVSIELNDSHVEVRCGRAQFSLGTMALEDYPLLPELPEKQGTVDARDLAAAIGQVVIATSKDDTLPLLTGVRVEIAGPKITFLATDRYRLAQREMLWNPRDIEFSAEMLVKARVLADVARNLTSSGDVELRLNPSGVGERNAIIGFSAGERQATSSLMDGDYPPVRKLFPEATPLEYACSRVELLEAVKRVSLVVERKTPVHLTFADGALRLEAGQTESAQAEESIALISESEELRTAFNPGYLQEGLAALETEFVRFGFVHATKAAVMMGQSEADSGADEDFKYLLMPIRFGL